MAQRLSNLPVGALIKDKGSAYYGKDIIWMKLEDNHYGMNETTLLTKHIISLKAFDAKEPKNTNEQRQEYGNARYIYSNIRQWLNSSAYSWYKAQHSADEPPTKDNVRNGYNPYASEKGFMTNLTPELKSLILPTKLEVGKSPIDGTGKDYYEDFIFLLSATEIGHDNNLNQDEGKKFDYFQRDADRVATVTQECVENSNYLTTGLKPGNNWYYWLRTPHEDISYVKYARIIRNSGSLNHFFVNAGDTGIRPALNIPKDTMISDKPDSDGAYVIQYNNSPEISGTDTNLGEKNQPFEIQYSVEDKDITDNVTVTEYLNNSLIRRITNANNTEQTLKITSELLNSCPLGETNTIKIYAEDQNGAGTYRNYWFKRTNTPPYFVEENTDLGTVTKAPTITFTPKDDDGDKYLKAKVKINQRVVKTYEQLGNGEQVSFTLGWKDFMQLNHSRKHNLWVEVEDSSGALATLKYTFERDTKKIEIATNTAPLDIKIKLMVFNANIKLGEGATFLQYACNDFGTKNTWEKIENGVPHEFANKHEGKDVIGYKCELTKGTGESEIRSIGGSFI